MQVSKSVCVSVASSYPASQVCCLYIRIARQCLKLVPFFIDNSEIACTRPADPLLSSVMTGLETVNCGKYTHGCGQIRIG